MAVKHVSGQSPSVLNGDNPVKYDPKEPITLFIVQVCIILATCYLIHWPMSKLRQPRVISEIIGGIILGPSVMGRVPGFHDAIFPDVSKPGLSLVAYLALVIYLFLMGLETNTTVFKTNWYIICAVVAGALCLPFGGGCALAWGIYNQFKDDDNGRLANTDFPTFMLFVGVAIAITAFPILCRIMKDLKMMNTTVGMITLGSGVASDVIGWILLALCVSLLNAGGHRLTALWTLLTVVGYLLFLFLVAKPVLKWLLRKLDRDDENAPPFASILTLCLALALASAFFTTIIGINVIFGGFLVGLVIPRERNLPQRIKDRTEEFVTGLLLPVYFTLSGLNTNIGLLSGGMTWAYVIAIILVALSTKIIGGSLMARVAGLRWRESLTVGALMSCKGLIELIVLNIGLNAGVLSTKTFTMFVVMALVTTAATTPMVRLLYPPRYYSRSATTKDAETPESTLPTPTQSALQFDSQKVNPSS